MMQHCMTSFLPCLRYPRHVGKYLGHNMRYRYIIDYNLEIIIIYNNNNNNKRL